MSAEQETKNSVVDHVRAIGGSVKDARGTDTTMSAAEQSAALNTFTAHAAAAKAQATAGKGKAKDQSGFPAARAKDIYARRAVQTAAASERVEVPVASQPSTDFKALSANFWKTRNAK